MDDRHEDRTDCAAQNGPRIAALLDGELSRNEQWRLEEHLRVCPICAVDLEQQRQAQFALHRAAEGLSAPVDLMERVRGGLPQRAPLHGLRRRIILLSGLAAVLAALAVVVWPRTATPVPSESVLARVVTAHQLETLGTTPVSYRSADADAVAAWARSGIGEYFEAPSLASAGYQLLGARMEPAVAPRAVTLVYEGEGTRLTCTVIPMAAPLGGLLASPAGTAPTHATRIQGSTVTSWRDRNTIYVLAADLGSDALLQLARLAAQAG
jgi:anti-sigma factor RsiW